MWLRGGRVRGCLAGAVPKGADPRGQAPLVPVVEVSYSEGVGLKKTCRVTGDSAQGVYDVCLGGDVIPSSSPGPPHREQWVFFNGSLGNKPHTTASVPWAIARSHQLEGVSWQ